MHLHGALRLLVGEFVDHSAVIGDGGRKAVHATGRKKCGLSAHAVADDADRTNAFQIADRRLDVLHHQIEIEIADQAARMRDLVRRISALEIARETIEHLRGDRGVANSGEAVAHGADVMIDSEYLLDDHDTAFRRSGRLGAGGTEGVVVRGGELDLLTQLSLPSAIDARINVAARGLAQRSSGVRPAPVAAARMSACGRYGRRSSSVP